VLRYPRGALNQLVEAINATGYGLTFGLHTRIDETIDRVLRRIEGGNIYINRNIIGATVGVQPFGGSGLSGTGPKAGGPRYLRLLLQNPPPTAAHSSQADSPVLGQFIAWLRQTQRPHIADRCVAYAEQATPATGITLAGPVGESNVYSARAHGTIAALGPGEASILTQLGAILSTGHQAVVEVGQGTLVATMPTPVAQRIRVVASIDDVGDLRAVLFGEGGALLVALSLRMAARTGAIVQVQAMTAADQHYDVDRLLQERSIATNTAAAGGNASLLALAG
jgi:RHH-type transcriptional regulator, proline utilization regulon repressor / proline dehydrogenase / delta 1-pyrroline-5-carboxylate dehydrogenase